MNIKQALLDAKALLAQSDSAELDAELLLAKVLNKDRAYLYTWPEKMLSQQEISEFQLFCQRRIKGHPIAYLIGERSFWNFNFKVSAQVLIPRPETELLVEIALEKIENEKALVADLGTGSGAIALSIAGERPGCTVLACDLSVDALSVARENAEHLKIPNVLFKQGAWCDAFSETGLDAVISNPPYIDEADKHLSEGDVRFEPLLALVSADNGLKDIKIIAKQAQNKLKQGGWLLLEHGYQQGLAVRGILNNLAYESVATHNDLSGNERVTVAKLNAIIETIQ